MKQSDTSAALHARRATTSKMLDRVTRALREMRRDGGTITVAAVGRRAGVSRTFLYQNADARRLIQKEAANAQQDSDNSRLQEFATTQDSWKARALNAEGILASAYAEIARQRASLAELLGKIRDLETDLPEGSVPRLISESVELKRDLRERTGELSQARERLQAARDNNRFLDARIADLEAKLLEKK